MCRVRARRPWRAGAAITYRYEETIDRSANEIWAYAADVSRHAEWMNVTEARMLSGNPEQVGARAVETMRVGRRDRAIEFEVCAAEPGRRIAWRALRGGPFTGEARLELEALGPGRTRAIYSGEVRLTGLWRLIEPAVATETKESERAELRRLKERLESAPRESPKPTAPIAAGI